MDRNREYLFDILTSARTIRTYVAGLTREDFRLNMQLQDAVIRHFEIIGEAAGRVSSSFQDANPQIQWTDMKGMRNRLIHHYDDVDIDIVWETIVRDIPSLIEFLESKLPPES